MSSTTNFAAAQERVLERRRLRDAEARNRCSGYKPTSPYNSPATLPYPVNRLAGSSLVLWRSIKHREGTRPAFRVGQVDAELLDEELLGLLRGQVGEALKYFGVSGLNCFALVWLVLVRGVDLMFFSLPGSYPR